MRPVILSRPEKTAVGLTIFCAGGAVVTASPGGGAVLAGCGVPRGRWPGAVAGAGAAGLAAGSAGTPGGGGKACDGIGATLGAATGDRGGSITRCWSTGGGGT